MRKLKAKQKDSPHEKTTKNKAETSRNKINKNKKKKKKLKQSN